MKRLFFPIALLLLIFSCTEMKKPAPVAVQTVPTTRNPVSAAPAISPLAQTPAVVSKPASKKNSFPKILSPDRLPKQRFTIIIKRDTIVCGSEGTKLMIPANAFVTKDGEPVTGPVKLELKEALTRMDMALGNLTTLTSDGKFLESGGMIYVNATANGEQLALADSKTIDVDVPATDRKSGMNLYEGKKAEDGTLSWTNPEPIDKRPVDAQIIASHTGRKQNQDQISSEQFPPQRDWMAWSVVGLAPGMDGWVALEKDIDTKYQGKIKRDTTIKIRGYDIHFFNDKKQPVGGAAFFFEGFGKPMDGINTFQTDSLANYVFSMKKLGWANIDRLCSDPRTKPVAMKTSISNGKDFDNVCITLILQEQNIFIPGYRKKDGTYCFSHGDFEQPELPVGESAMILATARKDGKIFSKLTPIVISPEQSIDFSLEETTEVALKKELETKL